MFKLPSSVFKNSKNYLNLTKGGVLIFDRPGVAGAVLQTCLSFLDSIIRSSFSSKSSNVINHKILELGPEILRQY